MTDANRKRWNAGQQKLRRALSAESRDAIGLFLEQHAMLHAGKLTRNVLWSFEDEILNDMTEEQIRCIPASAGHSVAWILFHLARIEDMTMNLLVAGSPQLFTGKDWMGKLKVDIFHSGNAMDEPTIAALSAQIDIPALLAYRRAVGRRTRQIVQRLTPEDFNQQIDPLRLQKVMEQGALLPAALGIREYWSRRTVAGLLLMPPTRHNFLHLNEALRIKGQVLRLQSFSEVVPSRSRVSSGE